MYSKIMNLKVLNIVFVLGAFLILVSSVLVMENVLWGKYCFAAGTVLFAIFRIKMTYKGDDFRLKRLNRFYFMSVLFLGIASYLQFKGYNFWVVLLLLVAILEFYTSVRASYYENIIASEKEASSSASENLQQKSSPKNDPKTPGIMP
jgi:hypothetical protein